MLQNIRICQNQDTIFNIQFIVQTFYSQIHKFKFLDFCICTFVEHIQNIDNIIQTIFT